MKQVFIVPGFAGSELRLDSRGQELVWINKVNLAAHGFESLALQDDGESDRFAYRHSVVSGNPLGDYYGVMNLYLTLGLASHDYNVRYFGYDWRKDWRTAGDKLSGLIADLSTPEEPATVVAHSTGGLVARWAYTKLVKTRDEDKLNRIITLGTPHRGTYAAVQTLSGSDPTAKQIVDVCALAQWALTPLAPFTSLPVSMDEVVRIFATFPGLYYLMPTLDRRAAMEDPRRDQLYRPERWPEKRKIMATWLKEAYEKVSPWMADTMLSVPPPWQLVTLGGKGYDTPEGLVDVDEIGEPEGIGTTTMGDSTVALNSAILQGYPSEVYTVSHSGLCTNPVILADILAYVLDPHKIGDPVPGVIDNPGPADPLVNPPPFKDGVPKVTLNRDGQEVPANRFIGDQPVFGFFPGPSGGGRKVFHLSIEYHQPCGGARVAKFTENYWHNADALKDALAAGKQLGDATAGLHGATTYVARVMGTRVPGEDGVAVDKESDWNDFEAVLNPDTAATPSDFPTNAIYMELRGDKVSTHQWIKGIRDSFVANGGFLQKALPEFETGMKKYREFLVKTKNGFVMRNLNKANKKVFFTSITAEGVFTTQAAHTLAVGSKIRISACGSNKYPNRIWKVATVPTPTTFTVAFWAPPTPFIPVSGEPFLRLQSYTYKPILDVDPLFSTKKNVGKVSRGLTGKAKKKK